MSQQPMNDVADFSHVVMAYDPAVIEEMARRLLARAQSLVVLYTLFGILLGLIPLLAVPVLQEYRQIGLIGLVLLGAVGYSIGSERGFSLKLQAQLLLCQLSVERNTALLLRVLARHQ